MGREGRVFRDASWAVENENSGKLWPYTPLPDSGKSLVSLRASNSNFHIQVQNLGTSPLDVSAAVVLFKFHFIILYVCAPHACLMPAEARKGCAITIITVVCVWCWCMHFSTHVERGLFCGLSYDLYADCRDQIQISEPVCWQAHPSPQAVSLAQLSDSLRYWQELGSSGSCLQAQHSGSWDATGNTNLRPA